MSARSGAVRVWTGSTWAIRPARVWNGTAWAPAETKGVTAEGVVSAR